MVQKVSDDVHIMIMNFSVVGGYFILYSTHTKNVDKNACNDFIIRVNKSVIYKNHEVTGILFSAGESICMLWLVETFITL